MYYHASPFGNISRLEPRISNHGIPLIYFSRKRENVLVYLSNAVEKYCRETGFEIQIPDAASSRVPVDVSDPEFVSDAYKEILEAEKLGLITIIRYEEQTDKKKEWIILTIKKEYEDAADHPEYRHFLKGNFKDIVFGG